LLVVACTDAAAATEPHASKITTHAVLGSQRFSAKLASIWGKSRAAPWGNLQRPPFDGPVDLRAL
jgi:hypothetical protein